MTLQFQRRSVLKLASRISESAVPCNVLKISHCHFLKIRLNKDTKNPGEEYGRQN